MRDRLGFLDEGAVALDERLVAVGVDSLEIWKRGEASDRVFRPHRRDLDFGSDGGANRQFVVGQSLVLIFAIEGHDGIADDIRQHDVATRSLDLVDHGTPFRVPELEVFVRDPFATVFLDQYLRYLGHLARVDVVRADNEEFLLAQRLDDPGDEVRELLVRNGAGVDDVLGAFEPFIIGGIEIQIVTLFEYRKDSLAARRGIGSEHRRNPILDHQLRGFFVVGLRIRRAILDNGVDLHALDAARSVDLADRHQRGVVKRFLDDRKAARQREQHAHIDRTRSTYRTTDDVRRCKRSGCRKQAIFQKLTPINRHSDTPLVAAPRLETSRLHSRQSALFELKIPESPEAGGPVSIRADSRPSKQKKPDRSSRIFRAA